MRLNLTHKASEAGQVNRVPTASYLPEAGLAAARLQVRILSLYCSCVPTTPQRLFTPNPLLLLSFWKDRQAGPSHGLSQPLPAGHGLVLLPSDPWSPPSSLGIRTHQESGTVLQDFLGGTIWRVTSMARGGGMGPQRAAVPPMGWGNSSHGGQPLPMLSERPVFSMTFVMALLRSNTL